MDRTSIKAAVKPRQSTSTPKNIERLSFCTDWRPLYGLCRWIDEKANEMALVWINLPSGVAANKVKTAVAEDGYSLQVTIAWPDIMVNCNQLHARFKNQKTGESTEKNILPDFHPKVIACKSVMRKIKTYESAGIENGAQRTTEIVLPFQVQKKMAVYKKLAGTDNSRVIYVELAGVNVTEAESEEDDFEFA